jgi:hypothetical protein
MAMARFTSVSTITCKPAVADRGHWFLMVLGVVRKECERSTRNQSEMHPLWWLGIECIIHAASTVSKEEVNGIQVPI